MARISKVSASFPRYIFRYWRGLDGSFILTTPPSPAALIPVQSFGKCRAPVRWRQGAEIRQRPSSPASANRLATSLVVFRIGEGRRSAPFAGRRGQPPGLWVEPDPKRSALLQGGILVAPVRRAAGRCVLSLSHVRRQGGCGQVFGGASGHICKRCTSIKMAVSCGVGTKRSRASNPTDDTGIGRAIAAAPSCR